jgi:hypothetical protein
MCKIKFSLATVIIMSLVLLVCGTAGIVLAQDSGNPQQDMTARVAQILGISQQKLTDAFKQAQNEFETQRLAQMVKDGKLTQLEADQLKSWESARPASSADKAQIEAWLQSRPRIAALSPPAKPNMAEMLAKLVKEGKITQMQADQLKAWETGRPDPKTDPQKFEAWLKARPDVPLPKPEGPPPGVLRPGFPPGFPMQAPPLPAP